MKFTLSCFSPQLRGVAEDGTSILRRCGRAGEVDETRSNIGLS
jgi:hypothetical protein